MDDESIKCIRMRLEDTREYYQAGMEGYDTQVLHDDACRLLAEVERLRADAARLDAVDRLAANGHDGELLRCLDMIQEGRLVRELIDDAVSKLEGN